MIGSYRTTSKGTDWVCIVPTKELIESHTAVWVLTVSIGLAGVIIIIIMYLYSAQYLHILQDSKRYLTNPTVQVQPQLTSN